MKYTNKNFLDKFFSERLGNFQKKPSSGVWENVSQNLDKPMGRFASIGIFRILYSSVLALAIGITAFFLFPSNFFSGSKSKEYAVRSIVKSEISPEKSNLFENQKKTSPALISIVEGKPEKLSNKSSLKSTAPILPAHNSVVLNAVEIYNSLLPNGLNAQKGIGSVNIGNESSLLQNSPEMNLTDERTYSDKRDYSNMDKIASMFHNISNNFLSLKLPDTSNIQREIKTREELFKMKGFHFAPIYQLNSKWISKQNTYEAFGKYRLAYKIGIGNSYGFAMGYDFSSRFGMQFEYIMQSEHGQNYEDIINRKNVKRNVVLNYMQFPLILKIKSSMMSGLTNKPFAVNYIAGLQYGVLKSAYLELNSSTSNIKNRFLNHDFAAIFGVETDLFLTRRLFLSTGLRIEYGLLDINGDGWKIKNGGASQNILSGMTCGLHYMIF